MKFIGLKKWSWLLCLVLLAAPAWGESMEFTAGSISADTILDFPEWASKDLFGSEDSAPFYASGGSLISNSLYPKESFAGNTVIVRGVPPDVLSFDFVAGGQSSDGVVQGNTVSISGSNESKVYIKSAVLGGVSRTKSATNNHVTISGTDSDTVIGSDDYTANPYSLYPGQVYGGYVTSNDGNGDGAEAKENTVTIEGGLIRGAVVGGFVQGPLQNGWNPLNTTAGSGDAIQNTVNIYGGTLKHKIFGGRVGSGDATSNNVFIGESLGENPWNWTSADEIIGGYSAAGSANGNGVRIVTPIKLNSDKASIHGGDGWNTANNNVVDIQANVNAASIDILGGWAPEGRGTNKEHSAHAPAEGNRVRLWATRGQSITIGGADGISKIVGAKGPVKAVSNIVEIYGKVSFDGKVDLFGGDTWKGVSGKDGRGHVLSEVNHSNKLILAVPKNTENGPLRVNLLGGFSSFDIFVRNYEADDVLIHANSFDLGAANGYMASVKVYAFGVEAGKPLYLVSSDTPLDVKFNTPAWGTDESGGVIKLEVTSEDTYRLAVSSDLEPVAYAKNIYFNAAEGYSGQPSAAIMVNTVNNENSNEFSPVVNVRPVGWFFTVNGNNAVILNSGLDARDEPYEGKIFVDFENGATAVAKVTAKISESSGGGGGSGGGDDSGDVPDPDPAPSDPTVPLPVDDAKVEGDTAAVTVDIPAAQINTAIDEAIQKAAEAGSAVVPTVSIPVVVPQTGAEEIKEAKVDISLETLEAIVAKVEESEAEDVALKISAINESTKLNVGEITLNTAALTELIAQAKKSGDAATVELVITKSETKLVEEKKLTAAQVTALSEVEDDDRVFDVSLLVGKTPITNFGGGTLTIALPYTLKSGESKNYIKVYNIPESAPKAAMPTDTTKETGKAIFTTTHLSVYAVIYDAPKPNPEPEPGEGGGGGGCDAGFGAAAGLFFAAAYWAARKGGKR